MLLKSLYDLVYFVLFCGFAHLAVHFFGILGAGKFPRIHQIAWQLTGFGGHISLILSCCSAMSPCPGGGCQGRPSGQHWVQHLNVCIGCSGMWCSPFPSRTRECTAQMVVSVEAARSQTGLFFLVGCPATIVAP